MMEKKKQSEKIMMNQLWKKKKIEGREREHGT